MFRFDWKSSTLQYAALFDIGSGTAAVGIAKFVPTEPLPQLIYSKRIEMRISEHTSKKDVVLRRVREAIFSSALLLSQEGIPMLKKHDPRARISKLFVTCSSPWSYNLARTVEYNNDEPFKITEAVIRDLEQSAKDTILRELKETHDPLKQQFAVVEQATVHTTVNDYSVENPLDLRGTKLSLSHVIGLIPKEILKGIHEVQEKLLPRTEIHAHTYMLIMYCILRDLFPQLTTCCIVDITGEAIEFGFVDQGILTENHALPFGSRTFIREAVEKTKRPTSDILSMIADYTLSKSDAALLKPTVDLFIERYSDGIKGIMSKKVIPQDIILTTPRNFENIGRQILEASLKKATGKEVNVITVDPKMVDEITAGTHDDVYLALEARFFHKLHGCEEIEGN